MTREEAIAVLIKYLENSNDFLEFNYDDDKEVTNEVKNDVKAINLAITALQEYEPWVSVKDRLPTEDDADENGLLLAWSSELEEWQVEVWSYVAKATDDYTHWKPLPQPPKDGEE